MLGQRCSAFETRHGFLHAPNPVRRAQKDVEIALFGGEFFDGDTDRQLVYGDLFVFNCSKERWRKIVIPHRRAEPRVVADSSVAVAIPHLSHVPRRGAQ